MSYACFQGPKEVGTEFLGCLSYPTLSSYPLGGPTGIKLFKRFHRTLGPLIMLSPVSAEIPTSSPLPSHLPQVLQCMPYFQFLRNIFPDLPAYVALLPSEHRKQGLRIWLEPTSPKGLPFPPTTCPHSSYFSPSTAQSVLLC